MAKGTLFVPSSYLALSFSCLKSPECKADFGRSISDPADALSYRGSGVDLRESLSSAAGSRGVAGLSPIIVDGSRASSAYFPFYDTSLGSGFPDLGKSSTVHPTGKIST